MKLSDYIIEFLANSGIHHNFLVSGGAVIHLVDSTAKHHQMQYICGQHEEHSAAAADMYSRVNRLLGLVMTTSGPGATNIVTSVANAYYDSVPLLCITGQVARFRIRKSKYLRQKGFQETDVCSIFQSITKYCNLVLNPEDIRYELEKAIYFAKEGRPGPVLLDIPDDLQRVEIDPQKLRRFTPPVKNKWDIEKEISSLFEMISSSRRPIVIFGAGIQSAKAAFEAVQFAEQLYLPVVCTWGGCDVIPYLHPSNMGCIGICGPRAGNFAVQNADLIIALGTRLCPNITGGKQNLFAPLAKKVMVDIDSEEIAKFGLDTFIIDLPICCDLRDFFNAANGQPKARTDSYASWRSLIRSWRSRYPIYLPGFEDSKSGVHPYLFIKKLSSLSQEGDIIIGDTGANLSWTMQAFETKANQRIFSAWNQTPMGYSLPASIGAAFASNRDCLCLIGDGGFMMCLQELATIRRHNLPIRIFIFNNGGHSIQKQTIENWLDSHYAAVDEATGLYFPDYKKIAEAFGIPFFSCKTNQDLSQLPAIWTQKGPFLCDVLIMENQRIIPMLKFGSGIEDLDPKISPEEMKKVRKEAEQICLEVERCMS
jgi:acetolactate synthase-1/2/3 large subunit